MTKNKDFYCLIGDPVSHSLSPVMQNSAFLESNIDAVYTTVLVKPSELERSISSLRELNTKGFNVTMPHKERVIDFVDRLDENANKIGAVNTVVIRDGKLTGYNTDGIGAVEAIRGIMKDLKGKRAVVLGRGGTGRAVSFGLETQGMKTTVLGRGEMLEESLSIEIKDADLVCNCTPIGMRYESTPIPAKLLRSDLVVFDAVYRDGMTDFIREARKSGCKTVDGLQMLVNQGANSFKLWTGKEPNRTTMLRSVTDRMREKARETRKNVYFVGFMGSGKSTVGKRVARELGREFVDTDEDIAANSGLSIKEIFEKYGEDKFRMMEQTYVQSVSEKSGVVVASGGGSVLNFENISRMKDRGTIVLLKADPSTIYERLREDGSRPILAGANGGIDRRKMIDELNARRPYYDIVRDFEIVTDGKSVDSVTREAIEKLGGVG